MTLQINTHTIQLDVQNVTTVVSMEELVYSKY